MEIFWRFCDDGSLLFTFLGSTSHNSELLYSKNHISLFIQRIFASGDSRTGGFIAAKIFPEETFVQKRPLGQEQFCPSKCLTLLGKSTCGLAKYWHTRIQLLGQSVLENVMTTDKNSGSSETLLLINLLMFSVSVQTCDQLLKTKAYYVALSSTLYYMLTDH